MSDVAVRIENVSKRYRLGQTHSRSIRDLVDGVTQRLTGRAPRPASEPADFWALRDVSLEIRQGDVVGIIGRNGAGKSTLLKILSRITQPTSGQITMRGRVASLLEVGTGFHPELTGRENVFLNGTILGMRRAEVRRQFDAIVDFAGVEKFIDTPVKRYSSGMNVRLGFAVAAHLQPEILIVDEVLAVGDAAFQKQCLGKMNDVSRSGRTILFVSHQMSAVADLCRRGIVLDKGQIDFDGPVDPAVDRYFELTGGGGRDANSFVNPNSDAPTCLQSIRVQQGEDGTIGVLRDDREFQILFTLRHTGSTKPIRLSIAICDHHQRKVFSARTMVEPSDTLQCLQLTVDGQFLLPGGYSVIAGLLDAYYAQIDVHRFVCPFLLEGVDNLLDRPPGVDDGVVYGRCAWKAVDVPMTVAQPPSGAISSRPGLVHER